MKELISMSTNIHLFFIAVTLILAVVNFLIVKNVKDYTVMTKRFELYSLLYYLSISVVVFTGFVVSAVFKFHISFLVYFMIFISLVIIVGAFKAHKLFKLTRKKSADSQIKFREFAAKKYILDIAMIVVTIFISIFFKS